MKIEHFVARSEDPRRVYDWSNLLGVCTGVLKGGPAGAVRICDTARGDRPLHVHPASPPPTPELVFMIERSGRIRPEGSEAEGDCVTLNLNADVLVEDRRAVINDLRGKLRRSDDIASIRRLLKTASVPVHHELPQYARVAVEYLQRKLWARENKHRAQDGGGG